MATMTTTTTTTPTSTPRQQAMTVTPPPTNNHGHPNWLQEVAVIHHAPCPCCNHSYSNSKETIQQQDEDDVMPGVLQSGVSYTPKRCLAEGYVHLKGSGHDWFGSRAWKPRYARLVLATVKGVDTPLLLIYWFKGSVDPSTVITLDSTVVIPVEKDDKEAWNAYGLEVVHVSSKSQRTTRTFTAGSQESRDAWLLVLNQALLQYEKLKACRLKKSHTVKSPPYYQQRWSEERFITMNTSSPPTPPPPTIASPPISSQKRPLPRPELPLKGEFLESEDN